MPKKCGKKTFLTQNWCRSRFEHAEQDVLYGLCYFVLNSQRCLMTLWRIVAEVAKVVKLSGTLKKSKLSERLKSDKTASKHVELSEKSLWTSLQTQRTRKKEMSISSFVYSQRRRTFRVLATNPTRWVDFWKQLESVAALLSHSKLHRTCTRSGRTGCCSFLAHFSHQICEWFGSCRNNWIFPTK